MFPRCREPPASASPWECPGRRREPARKPATAIPAAKAARTPLAPASGMGKAVRRKAALLAEAMTRRPGILISESFHGREQHVTPRLRARRGIRPRTGRKARPVARAGNGVLVLLDAWPACGGNVNDLGDLQRTRQWQPNWDGRKSAAHGGFRPLRKLEAYKAAMASISIKKSGP
jgi:hypothetical protein